MTALVKDDVKLKAEIAYRFQHSCFVWFLGGHDRAAHREWCNFAIAQVFDELLGKRVADSSDLDP